VNKLTYVARAWISISQINVIASSRTIESWNNFKP